MDLPEIAEVKRIAPQPGDRLVVRLKWWPGDEEASRVSGRVRGILGWEGPLLVLGPDVDVEVIGTEAGDGEAAKLAVRLDDSAPGEEFLRHLRDQVQRRGGPGRVFG